jgi:23S rRNA (adenine2503-C2)-methyltransferase
VGRVLLEQTMLIYDLSLPELESAFQSWGEPAFRATQTWHGIYKQLYDSVDEISTLPKDFKIRLKEKFKLRALAPLAHLHSRDGHTEKVLLETEDEHKVEAVLMHYDRRKTVCISTQAGCAMGCVFCATGQMGLRRNLSAGEIIEQVLYFARQLAEKGERLTNIVTMGMGEPFQNYEATMQAMEILNDSRGFDFGARRITISTVGIIPMIERFMKEEQRVNLAVSLHAATDDLRNQLIPINRRYPIHELLHACRQYVSQSGRRISFEWALIEGVNDSIEQARDLADLLHGMLCHVNLIPLNPTQAYAASATSGDIAAMFRDHLQSASIETTIRIKRGIDIHAGCGQLAGQG